METGTDFHGSVIMSRQDESVGAYVLYGTFVVQFSRIIKVLEKERPRRENGGVAQLGEHLPCKQGVMGSNPIISTSGKLPRPITGDVRADLTPQTLTNGE